MPGNLNNVGPYTICLGKDIDIDIDERDGLSYIWSDGVVNGDRNIYTDTILAFGQSITATYTLTIKDNANCSQDVDIVVIYSADIDPKPASVPGVEYGEYPVVLSGESIEIKSDNEDCEDYTWTWSLDTINQKTVTVSPKSSAEYYIAVRDYEGCVGYDTIYVVVGVKTYDAITPNGDGYNDSWTPLDIESYENALVQIFNRWGGLVFESKGGVSYTNNPWNGKNEGKELAVGTYYYIIDLNTGDKPQTGPITIIR
jgi:gliding motility-associated-like protein